MTSAHAMERDIYPLYRAVVSLAVVPNSALRDRWESLEEGLATVARSRPAVRGLLRGLLLTLSLRAAAQESYGCVFDCQYQFCCRSYGCATVPLGALALVGFYADLPHAAKVSLGTIGSLGAMFSSFISLAYCARDYLYEDDESASPGLRVVIAGIRTILDAPHTIDQV